jgi:hypothetical protein
MKSNKRGIHVRRSANSFLHSLFGRTTKSQTESKLPNGVNLENVGLDEQAKETVLEEQLKESEAFELVRRLQNC